MFIEEDEHGDPLTELYPNQSLSQTHAHTQAQSAQQFAQQPAFAGGVHPNAVDPSVALELHNMQQQAQSMAQRHDPFAYRGNTQVAPSAQANQATSGNQATITQAGGQPNAVSAAPSVTPHDPFAYRGPITNTSVANGSVGGTASAATPAVPAAPVVSVAPVAPVASAIESAPVSSVASVPATASAPANTEVQTSQATGDAQGVSADQAAKLWADFPLDMPHSKTSGLASKIGAMVIDPALTKVRPVFSSAIDDLPEFGGEQPVKTAETAQAEAPVANGAADEQAQSQTAQTAQNAQVVQPNSPQTDELDITLYRQQILQEMSQALEKGPTALYLAVNHLFTQFNFTAQEQEVSLLLIEGAIRARDEVMENKKRLAEKESNQRAVQQAIDIVMHRQSDSVQRKVHSTLQQGRTSDQNQGVADQRLNNSQGLGTEGRSVAQLSNNRQLGATWEQEAPWGYYDYDGQPISEAMVEQCGLPMLPELNELPDMPESDLPDNFIPDNFYSEPVSDYDLPLNFTVRRDSQVPPQDFRVMDFDSGTNYPSYAGNPSNQWAMQRSSSGQFGAQGQGGQWQGQGGLSQHASQNATPHGLNNSPYANSSVNGSGMNQAQAQGVGFNAFGQNGDPRFGQKANGPMNGYAQQFGQQSLPMQQAPMGFGQGNAGNKGSFDHRNFNQGGKGQDDFGHNAALNNNQAGSEQRQDSTNHVVFHNGLKVDPTLGQSNAYGVVNQEQFKARTKAPLEPWGTPVPSVDENSGSYEFDEYDAYLDDDHFADAVQDRTGGVFANVAIPHVPKSADEFNHLVRKGLLELDQEKEEAKRLKREQALASGLTEEQSTLDLCPDEYDINGMPYDDYEPYAYPEHTAGDDLPVSGLGQGPQGGFGEGFNLPSKQQRAQEASKQASLKASLPQDFADGESELALKSSTNQLASGSAADNSAEATDHKDEEVYSGRKSNLPELKAAPSHNAAALVNKLKQRPNRSVEQIKEELADRAFFFRLLTKAADYVYSMHDASTYLCSTNVNQRGKDTKLEVVLDNLADDIIRSCEIQRKVNAGEITQEQAQAFIKAHASAVGQAQKQTGPQGTHDAVTSSATSTSVAAQGVQLGTVPAMQSMAESLAADGADVADGADFSLSQQGVGGMDVNDPRYLGAKLVGSVSLQAQAKTSDRSAIDPDGLVAVPQYGEAASASQNGANQPKAPMVGATAAPAVSSVNDSSVETVGNEPMVAAAAVDSQLSLQSPTMLGSSQAANMAQQAQQSAQLNPEQAQTHNLNLDQVEAKVSASSGASLTADQMIEQNQKAQMAGAQEITELNLHALGEAGSISLSSLKTQQAQNSLNSLVSSIKLQEGHGDFNIDDVFGSSLSDDTFDLSPNTDLDITKADAEPDKTLLKQTGGQALDDSDDNPPWVQKLQSGAEKEPSSLGATIPSGQGFLPPQAKLPPVPIKSEPQVESVASAKIDRCGVNLGGSVEQGKSSIEPQTFALKAEVTARAGSTANMGDASSVAVAQVEAASQTAEQAAMAQAKHLEAGSFVSASAAAQAQPTLSAAVNASAQGNLRLNTTALPTEQALDGTKAESGMPSRNFALLSEDERKEIKRKQSQSAFDMLDSMDDQITSEIENKVVYAQAPWGLAAQATVIRLGDKEIQLKHFDVPAPVPISHSSHGTLHKNQIVPPFFNGHMDSTFGYQVSMMDLGQEVKGSEQRAADRYTSEAQIHQSWLHKQNLDPSLGQETLACHLWFSQNNAQALAQLKSQYGEPLPQEPAQRWGYNSHFLMEHRGQVAPSANVQQMGGMVGQGGAQHSQAQFRQHGQSGQYGQPYSSVQGQQATVAASAAQVQTQAQAAPTAYGVSYMDMSGYGTAPHFGASQQNQAAHSVAQGPVHQGSAPQGPAMGGGMGNSGMDAMVSQSMLQAPAAQMAPVSQHDAAAEDAGAAAAAEIEVAAGGKEEWSDSSLADISFDQSVDDDDDYANYSAMDLDFNMSGHAEDDETVPANSEEPEPVVEIAPKPLIDGDPALLEERKSHNILPYSPTQFAGRRLISQHDYLEKLKETDSWYQLIINTFPEKSLFYGLLVNVERQVDPNDPYHWRLLVDDSQEIGGISENFWREVQEKFEQQLNAKLKLDFMILNHPAQDCPVAKADRLAQMAVSKAKSFLWSVKGVKDLLSRLRVDINKQYVELYTYEGEAGVAEQKRLQLEQARRKSWDQSQN